MVPIESTKLEGKFNGDVAKHLQIMFLNYENYDKILG